MMNSLFLLSRGVLKNEESRKKLKEKGLSKGLWGYDINGIGVLPQSTGSVNEDQKALIEQALKKTPVRTC